MTRPLTTTEARIAHLADRWPKVSATGLEGWVARYGVHETDEEVS